MLVIGNIALIAAFTLSLFVMAVSAAGIATKRRDLLNSAENGVTTVFWLLNVTVAALFYLILISDFRAAYVAHYTSRDLPVIYKIAAFWGGQEGSLLLWSWLLAVFAYILVRQNRKDALSYFPIVVFVMMCVTSFFVFLTAFLSNPFDLLVSVDSAGNTAFYTAKDGSGLNPLLQHPLMIIHPPITFLGYAGFTVPFAYAVAALFSRQGGGRWISITRKWALFSWLSLGMGIILGARWAYVELGWGGYWGWDPVENASLMPWLTGTAFLHSVIIQEKKGMFKVWNYFLVVFTFLLCIFGTFITRSGLISSVHAFAESSIGGFFFMFIVIILILSFLLFMKRRSLFTSDRMLESVLSRESGFLFNNVVFLGACVVILWGTLLPTISEGFLDIKVTLGPPFFNSVFFPIGIFLLVLMGITPLLAFRRTSNIVKNLMPVSAAAAAVLLLIVFFWTRDVHIVIYFSLAVFVFLVIALEFYNGVRVRRKRTGENIFSAFINLVIKNKRRYGGYIVHFGMVMMFVGFAGAVLNKEIKREVKEGDSINIDGYNVAFRELKRVDTKRYYSEQLILDVSKGNGNVETFMPEKRVYRASNQSTSEVRISSTFFKDLYLIYAGRAGGSNNVILQVLINPFVKWVWIGGWVLLLGTCVLFLPDSIRKN